MDLRAVVERVVGSDGPLLVVSDYDGTLSPIVDDPRAARPLPDAGRALAALVDVGFVTAVVSGRPVEFLLRHLAVPGVLLVGQYGLERSVDGRAVPDPRARPYADAVGAAAAECDDAFPSLYVERKASIAVVVHWRAAGTITGSDLAAIEGIAARHDLAVHESRMARELRAPVAVDKGDAVAALIDEQRPAAIVFGGDDQGDLAAFTAVEDAVERGSVRVGIKVGVLSSEAPPELVETADLLVDGPAGFAALLDGLTRARAARAANPRA